jgi:hypothetical protein
MTRIEHHTQEEREAIKDRQRKETSDSSEYIVHTRAVDRSLWLQISFLMEKYKALVWLAGWFLIAMGFGFKTPKANYDELRQEIAVVRAQVQRDSVQKSEIQGMLQVLIRFKCIEMSTTPRDMQVAGVDCGRFISAYPSSTPVR